MAMVTDGRPSKAAAPSSDREASLSKTLVRLWPVIWPHDRRDLQIRVIAAFALLVLSKLVTLLVPFTFKWATDGLAALQTGTVPTGNAIGVFFAALPLTMIVAYGVVRILMTFIAQWKDALFAA
eukprot:gene20683-28382_t